MTKMRMMKVTLVKEGARLMNPSSAKRLVFGEVVTVPDAKFWHRRLKEGTVKLVTDESKKVPDLSGKKEPPPKKEKPLTRSTKLKKSDD